MQFFKNILQNEELRVQLACIAISGATLLASMLDIRSLPFDLAWIAVILCGVPIVWGALKGLVTEFDIKADVLVSISAYCFAYYWRGLCCRRNCLYHAVGFAFGRSNRCPRKGRH